ncbi:hypothetical protein VTP01DRAFT_7510 [Rhizomucor pusillus]|uniref:uncharacterized protein n=1 Tax=Rhizomucor pusillus TaxID=4840 RepID=UPI003742EFDC
MKILERSQLLQAIKKDLELASLEESAHGHAASRLVKNWRIVSNKLTAPTSPKDSKFANRATSETVVKNQYNINNE